MREIKFRAWDKEQKKWIPFIQMPLMETKYMELQLAHKDIVFCQFTGLHDKNGKEIFEGDIVHAWRIERFGSFNIPEDCIGKEIDRDETEGIVEYNYGQFYIGDDQVPIGAWWDKEYRDEDNNIEIIGNIYENPALLNPTKE